MSAREVRPADRAVPRRGDHRLDVDPDAALLELRRHDPESAPARLAHRGEPILERGPRAAAVVREHVHVRPFSSQLHLDRAHAARAGGRCRCGPRARVVIGEREHLDCARGGARPRPPPVRSVPSEHVEWQCKLEPHGGHHTPVLPWPHGEPAPTNRVALRDRREEVIARLSERFARRRHRHGRVRRRLDRGARRDHASSRSMRSSRTSRPSPRAPPRPPTPRRPPRSRSRRSGPARAEEHARGVQRHRAHRLVGRAAQAEDPADHGGGQLDFREASTSGPASPSSRSRAGWAGSSMIVPPGSRSTVEVSAIMGGVEARHAYRDPGPRPRRPPDHRRGRIGGLRHRDPAPRRDRARRAQARVKRERKSGIRELPSATVARLPAKSERDE